MNWFRSLAQRLRGRTGRRRFLCDSCAYNHPSACRMAKRPHALICEDYVHRGEKSAVTTPPQNLKL